MSELIKNTDEHAKARFQLLATACVSALLAITCASESAIGSEDADRPTLWIELGGQLEAIRADQDAFTAPFAAGAQPPGPFPFAKRYYMGPPVSIPAPDAPFDPARPFTVQKPPPNSFGGEAKISLTPKSTDWLFTVSLRYGRSNGHKSDLQQTNDRVPYATYLSRPDHVQTADTIRFSNARANYNESHAVLDFQAGRDVGLGLFGGHTQSRVDVGVRFAQFSSKSSLNVVAIPYLQLYAHYQNGLFGKKYHIGTRFHSYAFSGHSTRSLHGIGPSLSWSGATPLIGGVTTAQISLDWGVNGAVLFGRQKVKTDHKTTSYDRYIEPTGRSRITLYRHTPPHANRARSVVIPNLGGFAGMSLKFPNAKISLGYRADFFFGAMDAGIDTRHTEDMSFHGPFAKISIGLGG